MEKTMNTPRIVMLALMAANLVACGMVEQSTQVDYQTYQIHEMRYYPQNYSYDTAPADDKWSRSSREVTVPESYHVGADRSPVSHKNVDKNWVREQHPQNYTIEIADDPKASQVAGKLLQVPKDDRRAEVPYSREGKTYYKGLYGSYNTKEDAEKALNKLPADLKQGAGIKNWGNVQSTMD